MMRPAVKTIFLVYIIVIAVDLLLIIIKQPDLRWFSKPLLMPLLMMAYYISYTPIKDKIFYTFLGGLFFSWIGDVLLQAKDLFIPGLIAFLLAHLFYIFYFGYTVKKNQVKKRAMLPALAILLYVVSLLVLLFPYLGELSIPVIIYSLAIGTMLFMAIQTRYSLNTTTATLFIAGAILFVLSDSILAINLFILKEWFMGLAVMATYAAAQYFIVKGALSR